MSNTNFNTILDDLKASFSLATGHILSYFLAILGMLLVMMLLIVVVIVPVAIFLIFSIGPDPLYWQAVGNWWTNVATSNPWGIGGLGVMILVPFVAALFVVIGSIYGMTKHLIATGESRAEAAFAYFKRKFATFFVAGLLLTVIIVLPLVVLWGSASIISGYTVSRELSLLLSMVSFVWIFITVGFCANVFPAITYGAGAFDAFRESFNLATQRFDRVFGLWSAILILFAISFGPVTLWGLAMPITAPLGYIFNPVSGLILAWTVIAAFLWVLVFLPMTIIAFVRTYAEMTGKEIAAPAQPAIPIL